MKFLLFCRSNCMYYYYDYEYDNKMKSNSNHQAMSMKHNQSGMRFPFILFPNFLKQNEGRSFYFLPFVSFA